MLRCLAAAQAALYSTLLDELELLPAVKLSEWLLRLRFAREMTVSRLARSLALIAA